jgi:hypothetical protein
MRTGLRAFWFPAPRHGLDISARPCGASRSAVHLNLRPGFILPRASRLLQSFDKRPALLRLRAKERLPWGSSPSSRHQPAASTPARRPTPELCSVLGVSHALDGFLRHKPCGFVSPRCHVQGLPFRGFSLSAEPYRVSPADSCPRGLVREPPLTSSHVLAFRALLPAASAVSMRGVTPCHDPRPSWASPSSGFSLPTWCRRLHARSAHDLHSDEPTGAGPLRFAHARLGFPGTRLPTRARFLA